MFVCTGNICRSAFAEFYYKKLLRDSGNRFDLHISSAGTHALVGSSIDSSFSDFLPVSSECINHVSRQINRKILEDSGLILAFESKHKEWIINQFPSAGNFTYTLSEIVDINSQLDFSKISDWSNYINLIKRTGFSSRVYNFNDIEDPYRQSRQVQQDIANVIVDHVNRLLI